MVDEIIKTYMVVLPNDPPSTFDEIYKNTEVNAANKTKLIVDTIASRLDTSPNLYFL